ncbi:MAG: hypothetical protein MMC33_009387 [Icmadophila ericetorum]|nr:hypothetical protein [Icmadophila ericetorum]
MDETFSRGNLSALSAIPELNGAENWEDWIRQIDDYLILTNQSRCNANLYSIVKDMTHPREILDTLEENSKVQGAGVLTELYKQLDDLRLSDYPGVQEYSAKLRQIGNKLRNLGPEAAITNVQMVIFFLRGLGSSFDTFQASFPKRIPFSPLIRSGRLLLITPSCKLSRKKSGKLARRPPRRPW